MTAFKRPSDFIRTQLNEAVKQYLVYDAFYRMIEIYVAPVDAVNTDPCLKTTYEYSGASVRIVKSKESIAAWDSTWDI